MLVGNVHFGSAQTGTNVNGSINSDTTWTQGNNPYHLTGNVTVPKGVTLTIESGVQVIFMQDIPTRDQVGRPADEFHYHNLDVVGTLLAIGQNAPITFSYANQITFESSSSASVLQNVNFIGSNDGSNSYGGCKINILGSSPKLDSDSFSIPYPGSQISINGGSPIIENSNLGTNVGISIYNSAAQILNNNVKSNAAEPNNYFISLYNSPAIISDNNIVGAYTSSMFIISSGAPLITRNFISTSTVGMTIYGSSSPVIENNTFAENGIALNIYDFKGSPSPTIKGNNFEQNSQYDIYLGQQGVYGTTAGSINAAYNWWGTTDTSTINQSIFDHKNNNNIGTVSIDPILASHNKAAMPNASPNTPLPSSIQVNPTNTSPNPSGTSQNPTSTPQTGNGNSQAIPQEWLYGIIVALAIALAIVATALLVQMHDQKKNAASQEKQ